MIDDASGDNKSSRTEGEIQRRVLLGCIEQYISGQISRSDTVWCVLDKISVDSVVEDDLVTSAYWAARHLTEEGYWTTEEEIRYLYECLKGEAVYSQEGLESAIGSIDNLSNFSWNGKVGDESWLAAFIEAAYEKFEHELKVDKFLIVIAHYLITTDNIAVEDGNALMSLISQLQEVLFFCQPSEYLDKVASVYKSFHDRQICK